MSLGLFFSFFFFFGFFNFQLVIFYFSFFLDEKITPPGFTSSRITPHRRCLIRGMMDPEKEMP